MVISERRKNGVIICDIEGEIDITGIFEVKKVFKRFIDGKERKVLLNLGKADYIDSLGLAAVIGLLKRLEEIDGKLIICCVPPKIDSIFKVTKIDQALDIEKTEDEALSRF